jgi:hypothetical protein
LKNSYKERGNQKELSTGASLLRKASERRWDEEEKKFMGDFFQKEQN